MAKFEVFSVGFYENNPGEFWCDGTEELVGEFEIKGAGFPFSLSDRNEIYGKALALVGLRRSCNVSAVNNACWTDVCLWRYSKEYGGEIPLCSISLVKEDQ